VNAFFYLRILRIGSVLIDRLGDCFSDIYFIYNINKSHMAKKVPWRVIVLRGLIFDDLSR
jgi:hypothetical protein